MSSKPRTIAKCLQTGLFRPQRGIAAGAAGRRDHGRIAGVGRRRADCRVDARGRAQHAVGSRQLVAKRLGALAGGAASRRDTALRSRFGRRAIIGAARGRRRGLGRRCDGCRRCLRECGAGQRDQRAGEKERRSGHGEETAGGGAGSVPNRPGITICDSGSAKNAPSAPSGDARSG
jgi:hypothetical protein